MAKPKEKPPTSVEFVPHEDVTRVEVAVNGLDDVVVVTGKGYSSRDHGVIRALDDCAYLKRATVTTIAEAEAAGLPAPPRQDEDQAGADEGSS